VYHLKTHSFCKYDIEIDAREPVDENVEAVITAWKRRFSPGKGV
jgi:chloramphenicol 3-O phosphotransferase